MNFHYFPELELKWAYQAFWGICIVLAISMLIAFRRRGWLKFEQLLYVPARRNAKTPASPYGIIDRSELTNGQQRLLMQFSTANRRLGVANGTIVGKILGIAVWDPSYRSGSSFRLSWCTETLRNVRRFGCVFFTHDCSGYHRIFWRRAHSSRTLGGICRIHHKRPDGRGVFHDARIGRLLADSQPGRTCRPVLLPLSIYRVQRVGAPEH